MKHRAKVLADASSTARVQVEGMSACQRCAKGHGCGAGIFSQGTNSIELECATERPVVRDQLVTIEVDDTGSNWLWLVAGAYGLPTLGMLTATILSSFFLPSAALPESATIDNSGLWREAVVAGSALVGLAGGVFAWRYLAPKLVARLNLSLCLQSARIVAIDNLSVGEI